MKNRYLRLLSCLTCLALVFTIELSSRGVFLTQYSLSEVLAQNIQPSQDGQECLAPCTYDAKTGETYCPCDASGSSSGTPVVLEGTFSVRAYCDLENGKELFEYYLQTDDLDLYELKGIENIDQFSQRDHIKVEGVLNQEDGPTGIKNTIVDGRVDLIQKYQPSEESLKPSPGPRMIRVAVILLNFQNDRRTPWTRQQVLDKYFSDRLESVNRYYQENSYGKIGFTGDVFDNRGRYYTQNRNNDCVINDVEAINAADPDIVFNDANGNPLYDRVDFVYPRLDTCPWNGVSYGYIAYATQEGPIVLGSNDIIGWGTSLGVYSHEQGHLLEGLWHSRTESCPAPRYEGPGCQRDEYGNPYAVMGMRRNMAFMETHAGHFTASHKLLNNWFRPDDIMEVTTDGQYTLTPLEENNDGIKVLSLGRYYLEYRRPSGFDSFIPTSGVQINYGGQFTNLLDLHNVQNQYILRPGEVFHDLVAGIRVTALFETDEGIQMKVETAVPNPNLVAVQSGSWPSEALNGQQVVFRHITRNDSVGNVTDPFRVGFYIKSVNSPSWQLINSQTVPGVLAGNEHIENFNWVPDVCGDYDIRIWSDDQNIVYEANENDNIAPNASGHRIHIRCADLTITAHNWPDRGNIGQNSDFVFSAVNTGDLNSGSFTESFYVDNQLRASRRIDNLAPQQSDTTNFSWLMSCGVHEVKVVLDSGNEVREHNEGNNINAKYVFPFITSICKENIVEMSLRDSFNELKMSMDSNKVVWRRSLSINDRRIFSYDLTTNISRLITPTSFYKGPPDVSGNRIVWTESRNGHADLYLYDLLAGTERRLTTAEVSFPYEADIVGDKIVFSDYRDNNFNFKDIYLFDLNTNQQRQITTNPANQISPSMWGNNIVWTDSRNGQYDIYLYDLTTSMERAITTAGGDQINARIHGQKIAWIDKRSGRDEIYYYELATSLESKVTDNVTSELFSNIGIDNNRIVWMSNAGAPNAKVNLYDFAVPRPRIQILASGSLGTDINYEGVLSIWGDYVAYIDNGIPGYNIIKLYNFGNITPRIDSPNNGSSGQSNVTLVFSINQPGQVRFYDNDQPVSAMNYSKAGQYSYAFKNLKFGTHQLKVVLESSEGSGAKEISYTAIAAKTIKTTPTKTPLGVKRK